MSLAAAIAIVAWLASPTDDSKDNFPVAAKARMDLSKPPGPVATIASCDNATWEGESLEVGHTLREGDTVALANGEARISVGYGAEIAAEGPCSLKFVAPDQVELAYGDVAVHVAEWATGFTVLTNAVKVVDLGTTFTVSADKVAGVQTSVIKGLVRVHPKVTGDDGRRGVLIAEGGEYTVDKQGQRNAFKLAPKYLLEDLDLDALIPYRPIDLRNTGVGVSEGDEDPHWRVAAGPAETFSEPQFAMVCKPDERYLANDRETSQWVSMTGWRTATPNAVYTFQTMFDLDGYDLSTIQLFGRFLADNGVQEVRVNGKRVKVESWVDNVSFQEFDHSQFRFVNVTQGLVTGTNVVEIDVWNGIFQEPAEWRGDPNPMALRVEWYAFGRKANEARDIH
jgi:hypothetical protein